VVVGGMTSGRLDVKIIRRRHVTSSGSPPFPIYCKLSWPEKTPNKTDGMTSLDLHQQIQQEMRDMG
jgi:hypothetical protein